MQKGCSGSFDKIETCEKPQIPIVLRTRRDLNPRPPANFPFVNYFLPKTPFAAFQKAGRPCRI